MAGDEVDWGSMARMVTGGALAAVNPLIGVPMVIAGIFGESEKDRKRKQVLENADELFSKYVDAISEIESGAENVLQAIYVYLLDKQSKVNGAIDGRVLPALHEYPKTIDRFEHNLVKGIQEQRKEIEGAARVFPELAFTS